MLVVDRMLSFELRRSGTVNWCRSTDFLFQKRLVQPITFR